MNKVILSLGQGNLNNGLKNITAQLWGAEGHLQIKHRGSLPPNPELAELYQRWQLFYRAYYQHLDELTRIEIIEDGDDLPRLSLAEFKQICQQLSKQLNDWLDSDSFAQIKWKLGMNLHPLSEIQIIIETEDKQLRQLPWHLWNFFEDYSNAEVALSLPEYEGVVSSTRTSKGQVKILGILGSCTSKDGKRIDIQTDKALIEQLPGVRSQFLEEPSKQELKIELWEQAWDILFFAGHSSSQAKAETGSLNLNQNCNNNSFTIDEFEPSLRNSVRQGLKLAIFNSCDGLGLAWHLAKLNIPQTIVMGELAPDEVAQKFLQYFLRAFASGKSFYRSVREARERLKETLEGKYPCASWLPVICQNPAIKPPTWQDFLGQKPSLTISWWQSLTTIVLISLVVTGLVMGARSLGLLQASELKAFDRSIQFRSPEAPDDRFLLITISETDIQYQDRMGMRRKGSLSDEALEKLWQKLQPHQPRVIAMDIFHDFDFEEKLAKKLLPDKHFISVCEVGQTDLNPNTIASPPGVPIERLGFTDLPRDPDDVMRRQLLLMEPTSSCNTNQSFSLRVALDYLSPKKSSSLPLQWTDRGELKINELVLPKLKHDAGGYQLPTADANGYQILINYRSSKNFPEVSLRDLLNHAIDSQLADLVRDRIVLIGTAQSDRDSHLTPYSQGEWAEKMPGVVIQAHTISQIVSAVNKQRPLLWWWSQWEEFFWIEIWSLVGGLLGWYWRSPLYLGMAVFISFSLLSGLCFFLLFQGGWVPLIPSALTLILTILTSGGVVIYTKKR
jgi:CHASE2 domain-containing sensor protein